jgi:hypothetical protein
MPPRGVKKGTKRARQYEHIKDSEKEQGAVRVAGGGDRRTHGEQGTHTQRRVPAKITNLDAGHVFVSPRRAALRCQRSEGANSRSAL